MRLMQTKFYILIVSAISLLFCASTTLQAQNNKVNWLTIEEAVEKVEEEPRKIFIYIYTDWCGYCQRMEDNTFSHPVIIQMLNEKFYPVKLNAEQEEPITFQGHEYINENPGERRSAHNFAIAILQGQMSYPSIAFFDEDQNLITAIAGYRPPENMEPVLMFFYKEEYKTTPNLEEYIEEFDGEIN